MRTLLIANRGEIAVRIARSARDMGIRTVAVCSDADVDAVHVRCADTHVRIGPAAARSSYLDPERIIAAAMSSGADAIHPGYGFLSENAAFADQVQCAGLTFVGPEADSIRMMGDKARARAAAAEAGVPTVPGSDGPVADVQQALQGADRLGYPVAVKASAGGGGRGIRVVGDASEMAASFPMAQTEAGSVFGDPSLYLERFVSRARHIEVQVLGDGARVVHLGNRDCSMQRRRQKLVEEAPAADLPQAVRDGMGAAAVTLAESVRYRGAGTVEFLYDPSSARFYFMEMNTRIQVEHPVTEMVTGLDLVAEQLRIAGGEGLTTRQAQVEVRGHAIEVRVNAEDPAAGFVPSPGTVQRFRAPAGPFVRVDSGIEDGSRVSPYYDSLLAKIIAWGPDRGTAVARLRRALDEVEIEGVVTTVPFLRKLIDTPEFVRADYHTTTVEDWLRGAADHSDGAGIQA